ncbi:hypothetical protein D3C79_734040 [compost metagenome]
MQRTWLVAHRNDDRGLVVAGRRYFLVTDHQEARGVVRAVFDLLGQTGQAIQVGRHIAGDRRRIPLTLDPLGRFGIARYGHALHVRVVRVQPLSALGQRLGVGVDAGDAVGLGVLAHQQVVVDTQLDFTANHHVMLEEAVQGVADRTFSGVFHRHHTEVDGTGRHFTEHFVDGRHRPTDHRVAEVLHGRRLGEGAFRAEVGDFQRLFQGQARRHDFAEQPRHLFVAQRALVALHHALEHRSFTLGTVEHRLLALFQRGRLDPGYFFGAAGAVADQLEDFLVEAVDAHAQRLELLFGHVSHAPSRIQPCSLPALLPLPGPGRCRWRRACRPPNGGP